MQFQAPVTWMQGPKYLDHLQLFSQTHWQGAESQVDQPGLKLALKWNTSVLSNDLSRRVTMPTTTCGLLLILILVCFFQLPWQQSPTSYMDCVSQLNQEATSSDQPNTT